MGSRFSRAARARAAAPPAHRSLNSLEPTLLEFRNETRFVVRTRWLGYDAASQAYCTLLPAATCRQPSFATHPWTFEVAARVEPGGGFRAAPRAPPALVCAESRAAVVYARPPLSEATVVRIVEAAPVAWSPEAHAGGAFAAFAPAARAFLLAARRLEGSPRARRPARAPSVEEELASASLEDAAPSREPNGAAAAAAAAAPPAGPGEALAPASSGRGAGGGGTALGALPRDVLLQILALAAPRVLDVRAPPRPAGVGEAHYSEAEAAALFAPGAA
jgi:hypothetical protein